MRGIVEDVKCLHWKDGRGIGMFGMCAIGHDAGWFPTCHNLLDMGACPLGKQKAAVAERMPAPPKYVPKPDLEPPVNPPKATS